MDIHIGELILLHPIQGVYYTALIVSGFTY